MPGLQSVHSYMVKFYRWIFALSIIHISAFAWAGSVVDMPIGDAGKIRYGIHSHTQLQGSGIAINDLIYGTKTLETFAQLAFTTAKATGQSGGGSLLYGPGGGIVVRGCISRSANEGSSCHKGDFRGVIMRGTFLDAKLVDDNGKLTLIARFVETLNPLLAAMLGVPVQSQGTLDLVLSNLRSYPWIVDKVDGGSLNILSEPSSLATLGSGLLGLFLVVGASVMLRRGNTSSNGSAGEFLGTEQPVYRS
jgi:hypothetical protein